MPLIDISQPLVTGMPVWPGDAPFATSQIMDLADGDVCNLGSMALGLHTGTHADAPRHFLAEGRSIADCELEAFVGEVVVVDASDTVPVGSQHLSSFSDTLPERILFKTGTGVTQGWHDRFSHVAPDAAERLVLGGVQLVGIDTPSVDGAHSTTHATHEVFARGGVVILENLFLDHVKPGVYDLIALPLKLIGMEASPVRAILRTRD
jgi:arylformamidase